MKLLTAPASPFANKVRMAAKLTGFELEAVNVNAAEQPKELIEVNPLGKIPCLVLDDGRTLFDNRPILQYLDRENNLGLYPKDSDELVEVARFEALCDGIADCAVAWQYEKRMRPEEKYHEPWLEKQWGKITRGLTEVADALPELEKKNIKIIALAAVVGYLQLRFEGQWENQHKNIIEWMGEFEQRYPDVAELKPSA